MSRYCLDTSAYSRFISGEPRVTELIDQASWIGVPAIVTGELRAGFLQGSRPEHNERLLCEFLDHPAVEHVRVDEETAQHYSAIVHDLRRAGTPIPTNDVWIAACGVSAGAPVLTFDAHFAMVQRVGSIVLP